MLSHWLGVSVPLPGWATTVLPPILVVAVPALLIGGLSALGIIWERYRYNDADIPNDREKGM